MSYIKFALKFTGLALLGALGIFMVFGLVPLVWWLIDPKSDWVGPSSMLVMLGGMLAYMCYLLGDGVWEWLNGRWAFWGLD